MTVRNRPAAAVIVVARRIEGSTPIAANDCGVFSTQTGSLLAVVALLVAVSGCATSSGSARIAPTSATHPSATASASPQARVRSADVDGDGRSDDISIRWLRRTSRNTYNRGSLQVFVRFARGGTGHVTVPVADWVNYAHPEQPSIPYSAAAQLDGVPGDEVVIDSDNTPASFRAFAVVTDHAGRLLLLPAPPRHTWWVGATVGTGGNTYDCPGNGLTAIDSSPIHRRHRQIATDRVVRTRYTWTNDHWRQIGRTFSRGDGPAGNWVCPSLTNWPGAL